MQAHLYDADANTFLEIAHRRPNCEWIDAAIFPAQNRGMAKKASGAIGGASSTSPQSEKPAEKLGRRGTPPSETHTAKKENSLGGASVPASRSPDAKTAREDSRPTKLKPSSLLDTCVIYCGDNLEQLANHVSQSTS